MSSPWSRPDARLTRTGTNHYAHYIDVDAFVDQHWIVEFPKQIDGYRISNFFSKDRNDKVKNVPIWDWNLSFGNANYLEGGLTKRASRGLEILLSRRFATRRLEGKRLANGRGRSVQPHRIVGAAGSAHQLSTILNAVERLRVHPKVLKSGQRLGEFLGVELRVRNPDALELLVLL